jgi:hypothetical protein
VVGLPQYYRTDRTSGMDLCCHNNNNNNNNTLLTFMGPCIVNIFRYISNKMQLYTVYLYIATGSSKGVTY